MVEEIQRPAGQQNSDRAPNTGNQTERLEVSSGWVVIIDQFMLANSQFVRPLASLLKGSSSRTADRSKLEKLVEDYGGCLVDVPVGTYHLIRDAEKSVMVVSPENIGSFAAFSHLADSSWEAREEAVISEVMTTKTSLPPVGRVFVDTRCVVFGDIDLTLNEKLLAEYSNVRGRGDEKRARDLLRAAGATVRYGFRRYGDELGVYRFREINSVALWPDVVD